MNQKARMLAGKIYFPGDDEIMAEQTACLDRLYDFNATRPGDMGKRYIKDIFKRDSKWTVR